jgi:hypothetical protein
MSIWQVDFYRRPLVDQQGNALWELVACDPICHFTAQAFCAQSEATANWLTQKLQEFAAQAGALPQQIQVFRPQAVSLIQTACLPLGITVTCTRRTPALKQLLHKRASEYPSLPGYTGQPYHPTDLEKPPPVPLPENLWGDRWQFATLAAGDLLPAFQKRSIPIRDMPEALFPLQLQIPSTALVPGVIIEAGRRSMPLARWLQQAQPVALNYIPGDPNGLLLEAGLVDRWVLTTFTDPDVIAAAKTFQARQQAAKGLHFLLVQPDDSGMTYSGFWLLQTEPHSATSD